MTFPIPEEAPERGRVRNGPYPFFMVSAVQLARPAGARSKEIPQQQTHNGQAGQKQFEDQSNTHLPKRVNSRAN